MLACYAMLLSTDLLFRSNRILLKIVKVRIYYKKKQASEYVTCLNKDAKARPFAKSFNQNLQTDNPSLNPRTLFSAYY